MWLCWMQFYCSALSLVQIEGCGSVEACVCIFNYWYTFFFVCFFVQAVSRTQLLMYHRHCSAMLPDGRIVILGGGGNCFSFGTHLNFTPVVLDISQCLEAVPWEGHHFHQHHSTPGWWGVLGGVGVGSERGGVIYLFITSHSSWSYSTCCISPLLRWMCMVLSLTETLSLRWMQQASK